MLIEGDRKGWDIPLWHEEFRAIFDSVLNSENKEAVALANTLINQLGARGFRAYRDLLR